MHRKRSQNIRVIRIESAPPTIDVFLVGRFCRMRPEPQCGLLGKRDPPKTIGALRELLRVTQ